MQSCTSNDETCPSVLKMQSCTLNDENCPSVLKMQSGTSNDETCPSGLKVSPVLQMMKQNFQLFNFIIDV